MDERATVMVLLGFQLMAIFALAAVNVFGARDAADPLVAK